MPFSGGHCETRSSVPLAVRSIVGVVFACLLALLASSGATQAADCVGPAEFCKRLGIGADVAQRGSNARRQATLPQPAARKRGHRKKLARRSRSKLPAQVSRRREFRPARARPAAPPADAPEIEANVGQLPRNQLPAASAADHAELRVGLHRKAQERLAELEAPVAAAAAEVSSGDADFVTSSPPVAQTVQAITESTSTPERLAWLLVPFAGLLSAGALRSLMRSFA